MVMLGNSVDLTQLGGTGSVTLLRRHGPLYEENLVTFARNRDKKLLRSLPNPIPAEMRVNNDRVFGRLAIQFHVFPIVVSELAPFIRAGIMPGSGAEPSSGFFSSHHTHSLMLPSINGIGCLKLSLNAQIWMRYRVFVGWMPVSCCKATVRFRHRANLRHAIGGKT